MRVAHGRTGRGRPSGASRRRPAYGRPPPSGRRDTARDDRAVGGGLAERSRGRPGNHDRLAPRRSRPGDGDDERYGRVLLGNRDPAVGIGCQRSPCPVTRATGDRPQRCGSRRPRSCQSTATTTPASRRSSAAARTAARRFVGPSLPSSSGASDEDGASRTCSRGTVRSPGERVRPVGEDDGVGGSGGRPPRRRWDSRRSRAGRRRFRLRGLRTRVVPGRPRVGGRWTGPGSLPSAVDAVATTWTCISHVGPARCRADSGTLFGRATDRRVCARKQRSANSTNS